MTTYAINLHFQGTYYLVLFKERRVWECLRASICASQSLFVYNGHILTVICTAYFVSHTYCMVV